MELHAQFSTMEYTLPRPSLTPPVFLLVVDTCMDEDELSALKETLVIMINILPSEAIIGLVTFGTMVHVHELGYAEMPKSFVFRGSKDYTQKQIQEMLCLQPTVVMNPSQRPHPGSFPQASNLQPSAPIVPSARFLLPVGQCEYTIGNILDQLQKDPWPVESDKRRSRATGAALSIATSLLETTFPNTGSRILLFSGGPCTIGPGQVVGLELKEPIRSHHDIVKDNAKHVKAASKFYEKLTQRLTSNSHAVDIFAGCYDQIGTWEMKSMINSTGGVLILSDSFKSSIFKQSCQRLFEKAVIPSDAAPEGSVEYLKMAFHSTFEVQTSRELKVCGLIGPATSLNKKTQSVSSDMEIGIGGTVSWKLCSLSPRTTLGIYFDISGAPSASGASARGLIQFTTTYQHSSGQMRFRVTTVCRSIVEPTSPHIKASFDQEAAAVLISRVAVFKAEVDDGPDVLRWVDRMLIRLCQKIADYRKDEPNSFVLSNQYSIYPQFMFHLRRSQFLQVFNNSPDETAYVRHLIFREDTNNCLTMIQPTMTSYSLSGPPVPALLDAVSLQPDVILLLDTFFHIVIYHGETIASWIKEGYHLLPEYAHLKQLLESPKEEAKELLRTRFPIPRYVVCNHGESQGRFLLSKLNPSTAYHHTTADSYGGMIGGSYGGMVQGANATGQGATSASQFIFTDDVSLQVFIEHLKKLSVSSST